MTIQVNDWVVHPQHGVGRVVNLQTRQFGAGTLRRYYEIALSNGTMWVPVDEAASGLRKLTSRAELPQYRRVLKGRPTPLAGDFRERQIHLSERRKLSSFRSRCELVRDLTAFGWRKPLTESSGTLLRNAQDVLCEEWAVAEGLSALDAAHEVEALLLEGRRLYEK